MAAAKKDKGPSSPGKKRFHNHVEKAIAHNETAPEAERKSVHVTYQKLNGRTVKRKVSPLRMNGHTIIAYDHKRKALRSFRMERVKHMEKAAESSFFAGFEKQASAFAHGAELAGLGTLAAPSIQKLRGKPMQEKNEHKTELAGLGILAAPSLAAAGKGLISKFHK